MKNLITIMKDWQKFTLACVKEKGNKVKNLSLVKSYSVEKQVTKVISDIGMDLKKDLVDNKVVLNDNKVRIMVAGKMDSVERIDRICRKKVIVVRGRV